MRAALVAVVVVAVCAGCGGGREHYELGALRSCAEDAPNVMVDDDATLDYVAEDATGGAVALIVTGSNVTVALGRTENDAKRIASAYRLFAEAFDTPVDDIVYRRGNAVVVWENTPTDLERELLEACLT
jgi:hypothetical protein